jgi:predicted Zn-dependent protease
LGYLTQADAESTTDVAEPSLLPDPKDKVEEQNLLHDAMIATEDGRLSEARAAFEKVVDSDPQSAVALVQLGQLELQMKDYPNAAHHLSLARPLRSADPRVAFDEGRAKDGNGDLAGAKEALKASLALNPAQLDARLLVGKVDLKMKDLKSAEDGFEAALLLQPANMEARLGKARVQLASGKFSEAAKQLEAMKISQPHNAAIFDLLVQAYAALGEREKAEEAEKLAKTVRDHSRR